jgi:hypothetical protein
MGKKNKGKGPPPPPKPEPECPLVPGLEFNSRGEQAAEALDDTAPNHFERWTLAEARDYLVLVHDAAVPPPGGARVVEGESDVGTDRAIQRYVEEHRPAWARWLVDQGLAPGPPVPEPVGKIAEPADRAARSLEDTLVAHLTAMGLYIGDKQQLAEKALWVGKAIDAGKAALAKGRGAAYALEWLLNHADSPFFRNRFGADRFDAGVRRKFWRTRQPSTTVLLPQKYSGCIYARVPSIHSGGGGGGGSGGGVGTAAGSSGGERPAGGEIDTHGGLEANADDIFSQSSTDGTREPVAAGFLPTNEQCVDAATVTSVAGTTSTVPPGWFSRDGWLFRFCAPTAPQDPNGPILRGRSEPTAVVTQMTSVLEVVHSTELASGSSSAFQLTLSASGGCVLTTRGGGGDPVTVAPVPARDVHALVALPAVGGGSWQLRTLVRFQAFETLRTLLCNGATRVAAGAGFDGTARARRCVADALAEEEKATSGTLPGHVASWATQRALIYLLVDTEAPQEIVRAVVTIGSSAVTMSARLECYIRELRSPCRVGDWCINVVKDDSRKHNIVLYHTEKEVYIGLHPESGGTFALHSPNVHATNVSKDGGQQHAPSAVLFCRFRKLVCRQPLPEGRYVFGQWTISCRPSIFSCLEIHHSGLTDTKFKLTLSAQGSATFTNCRGKSTLLAR